VFTDLVKLQYIQFYVLVNKRIKTFKQNPNIYMPVIHMMMNKTRLENNVAIPIIKKTFFWKRYDYYC
jgi:hypothetical protein